MEGSEIVDVYGRQFKTLRLSLTNTCNLGCIYCVEGESQDASLQKRSPIPVLSLRDLLKAVKALTLQIDLHTIRLTGGEPTLYKELVPLIRGLKELGIEKIKMTSNGYLLKNNAFILAQAGLTNLNISLDAIDPNVFYKISRRKNIERIIAGIEESIKSGIEVKLNSVIMNGVNNEQILPLLKFAKTKRITIRFLELMRMGYLHESHFSDNFFSESQILEEINKEFKFIKVIRQKSSTSNYWITDEGQSFGIIANESNPFCHDCNRLRLDSYGNIYGCLSENKPLNIFHCLDDYEALSLKLKEALTHKQPLKFKGSEISMLAIGG